jgi:uncharacterized membrane-anchored protein
MLCSCQSGIIRRTKLPLAFCLLSAATVSLTEVSYADSSPESPIVPKAPVAWTAGPTQVQLGTIASLQIPQGYKFTDAQGAKDELAQLKVLAPNGLLGIVEPKAGGSCITVQFSDVGYIEGVAGKVSLSEADMLKNASKGLEQQNGERSNQNLAHLADIAWDSAPVLDPSKPSLEWALRANAGSEHLILCTLRLFARNGVLDLATVLHSKSSQPDPLKEIAGGVTFKTGEAYADYAVGDKTAAINVADLVLNTSSSKAAGTTWTIGEQKNLWLIGGAVFVLVISGIIVIRKSRNRKSDHRGVAHAAEAAPDSQRPAAPAYAAKPVISVQAPKPRTMSQVALNKAAGFPKPSSNGNNNNNQSARRKKVFDYNRYFTDLMSAVSSQANQADVYQSNGYALENGRVMPPYEVLENGANSGSSNSQNSEMIAHQKLLIEEQKRIIQEQSKLIEEKSRLIAEKNQLLKMQAELLEGKLL